MMATVPRVTSDLELTKFQADGFLLTRVYVAASSLSERLCGFLVNYKNRIIQTTLYCIV